LTRKQPYSGPLLNQLPKQSFSPCLLLPLKLSSGNDFLKQLILI
jgi:hypothetical protein